jgi:hypothetical protein
MSPPSVWNTCTTPESGVPYYHNPMTEETTWEKPEELVAFEKARRNASKGSPEHPVKDTIGSIKTTKSTPWQRLGKFLNDEEVRRDAPKGSQQLAVDNVTEPIKTMDLSAFPGEIRNAIYDEVLHPAHFTVHVGKCTRPKHLVATLLQSPLHRVSRQMRLETVSRLLSTRKIWFSDVPTVITLLKYLGPEVSESITSMSLWAFNPLEDTRRTVNMFKEFASEVMKLRGLKALKIQFLEITLGASLAHMRFLWEVCEVLKSRGIAATLYSSVDNGYAGHNANFLKAMAMGLPSLYFIEYGDLSWARGYEEEQENEVTLERLNRWDTANHSLLPILDTTKRMYPTTT